MAITATVRQRPSGEYVTQTKQSKPATEREWRCTVCGKTT